MLSRYFKFKTKRKEFTDNALKVFSELKGKRILVYGEPDGFAALNKYYKIDKICDIAAFVPTRRKKLPFWYGIKNVKLKKIINEKFDAILVTSERGKEISYDIMYAMKTDEIDIKILFVEDLFDAEVNLEYLLKYDIEKSIKRLEKILKGKRAVFYGSGLFFKVINEYFDLSNLDIIGVVDKHFSQVDKINEVCGYKLYSPDDIIKLNPDYVVVTTRIIRPIFQELYFKYLRNTNIKVLPILKRSIWSIIFEG